MTDGERRLVTLAMAITLLGIPAGTVYGWRGRAQFPAPDLVVDKLGEHRGVDLWWWPDLRHRIMGVEG